MLSSNPLRYAAIMLVGVLGAVSASLSPLYPYTPNPFGPANIPSALLANPPVDFDVANAANVFLGLPIVTGFASMPSLLQGFVNTQLAALSLPLTLSNQDAELAAVTIAVYQFMNLDPYEIASLMTALNPPAIAYAGRTNAVIFMLEAYASSNPNVFKSFAVRLFSSALSEAQVFWVLNLTDIFQYGYDFSYLATMMGASAPSIVQRSVSPFYVFEVSPARYSQTTPYTSTAGPILSDAEFSALVPNIVVKDFDGVVYLMLSNSSSYLASNSSYFSSSILQFLVKVNALGLLQTWLPNLITHANSAANVQVVFAAMNQTIVSGLTTNAEMIFMLNMMGVKSVVFASNIPVPTLTFTTTLYAGVPPANVIPPTATVVMTGFTMNEFNSFKRSIRRKITNVMPISFAYTKGRRTSTLEINNGNFVIFDVSFTKIKQMRYDLFLNSFSKATSKTIYNNLKGHVYSVHGKIKVFLRAVFKAMVDQFP